MGFYSKNIHSLKDIPDGATFAIPNDPSNEGRGLQLIEKAGLIKLQPGKDGSAITVADIIDNPKHLKFKELEAAQLPRFIRRRHCYHSDELRYQCRSFSGERRLLLRI